MEENNNNWNFWGWIILGGLFYFMYQNGKLQDQVKSYKEQSAAYDQCVSDYQDQESKFKQAIDDASSYLDYGGTYNYRNAQDALNIDTSEVSCDIPEVTP